MPNARAGLQPALVYSLGLRPCPSPGSPASLADVLQTALADMKTRITYWRQVLDIDKENQKAARNIEVARLTIKDILDQINKQRDPNQPQDPNQTQQRRNQQGQSAMQQDPNQPRDPNQAQDPNQSRDPNDPDKGQQESQPPDRQQAVAPDATAQEILDKEQRRKERRQFLHRAPFEKVKKDW